MNKETYLEELRDHYSAILLEKLMLRYNEDGYTDKSAINESWKLADYMLETRNSSKNKESTEIDAQQTNVQICPHFRDIKSIPDDHANKKYFSCASNGKL